MVAQASIIIPVKNGGPGFVDTLRMLFCQRDVGDYEVIIIDSGSTDQTLEMTSRYPVRLVQILPEEFGHARTRNLGASLASSDIIVFTVADAVPATNRWLSHLLRPFEDRSVAGVYGRQIPRPDAPPSEQFFLRWHYPNHRRIQQANGDQTSRDTIFFSNVSSAMRATVFSEVPFAEDLIISEDQMWAKSVLRLGYTIVYEPDAAVIHTNHYTLTTLFRRYFDIGTVFAAFAKDEYHSAGFSLAGLRYFGSELVYLIRSGHLTAIPYSGVYNFMKFAGLMLGMRAAHMPPALVGMVSERALSALTAAKSGNSDGQSILERAGW